jgi:DNA primase small subunit
MSKRNPGRARTVMKLRLLFHEYYSDSTKVIDVPDRIQSREFALQTWEHNWHCVEHKSKAPSGKEMRTGCGKSGKSFQPLKACPNCGSEEVKSTSWIRHVGYQSKDSLRTGLATSAPQSVYHSAAFYRVPIATHMHEKEWQGAELVFDIDADHLDLKCANEHDAWRCNNPECHKTGTGLPPEACPVCGNSGFTTRKWICEKCLDEARSYTKRLYDDFLVGDFGFDPDKIQINYSGHRGYHVRVRDPQVYSLDSNARVEIVHYIMGLGFRSDKAIVTESGTKWMPARDFPGWSGRIADAMVEFIRSIDSYPGTEKWVSALSERKVDALEGLQRPRPVLSKKVKGVGVKSWQEVAEKAVELYGSKIDRPVTHDIHRVIRLINSLNGKTGLVVSLLTRDELDDFDPFNESIAFNQGIMKVIFNKGPTVPRFKMGSETYGPFTAEESVELPMAAAVFVLCKGVASIE